MIELDDNSHTQQQRERDSFVEKLYATTGYKLLRVKGHMNIKEKIQEKEISNVDEYKKITNNVILCFDGDSAGEKATMAVGEQLEKIGISPKVIALPSSGQKLPRE